MKTMKFLGVLAIATIVTVLFTVCHAAAVDRPIIAPDVRVSETARSVGIKLDLISLAKAKRPTKSVYREEAVALWRPAPGQLIAANEAPGTVADVNAAVTAKEVVVEKGLMEAAGDHIRRNAGKYIAGAAVAVAGGVGYAIVENNKDGNKPDSAPPVPTNTTDARQSPAVSVTAGDGSPVTINLTITAMPPE
jgi:hypothetical protein